MAQSGILICLPVSREGACLTGRVDGSSRFGHQSTERTTKCGLNKGSTSPRTEGSGCSVARSTVLFGNAFWGRSRCRCCARRMQYVWNTDTF